MLLPTTMLVLLQRLGGLDPLVLGSKELHTWRGHHDAHCPCPQCQRRVSCRRLRAGACTSFLPSLLVRLVPGRFVWPTPCWRLLLLLLGLLLLPPLLLLPALLKLPAAG